ncbi:HigA family addiction module antitoxin [Ruminococcus flavefaciens]|uniref:HigA family addiction module antitoxin n=1 Tax=Ruminococcus flavefaciens TaxID=1265 RepID=UPI0026EF6A7F|nr:HigA family addiction module antitoxin [Ruminococcus flavefaciens]
MNKNEYNELIAFHPGYYISEIIEEMELTQEEFSKRLGVTPKHLSEIVNGKAKVTPEIAQKLSIVLDSSVEMWLNLQMKYDIKITEIKIQKERDEQIRIFKELDYQFFVKNGFIDSVKDTYERAKQICSFLKIADLAVLKRPDLAANFRSSSDSRSEKNIINANAWLEVATKIGKERTVGEYDAQKLKSYLPEIRRMTVQDPSQFSPRLNEIFAECGVAFVLLPKMKNAKINGVVKWLTNSKALVAMNDRMSYADTFWFSLFHEIEHVFQHKTKQVMISCNEDDMYEINKQYEDEADAFSQNYLIDPDDYAAFVSRAYFSKESVTNFAKHIGIHPGIVVGRLQKDTLIGYNVMNDLKIKYRIS